MYSENCNQYTLLVWKLLTKQSITSSPSSGKSFRDQGIKNESSNRQVNLTQLIGGVVGAVVGVLLLVGLYFSYRFWLSKKQAKVKEMNLHEVYGNSNDFYFRMEVPHSGTTSTGKQEKLTIW